MAQERIPVVVIGVGGIGRWTLQALRQSPRAEVVGISDIDPAIAERAGAEFATPIYTDNRSLLAETRPAAAFVAVPPKPAAEIVKGCAERGIHVWKEIPAGRGLNETVGLIRLMDEAGLKFAVGTQRRFAVGYRRMWELRRQLGRVFLGRGHYLFNWGPKLAWRGDKASAGGGALLELGYHPIDLMCWLLGLPEDVYGINTAGNRPEGQTVESEQLPLYDTDDTAASVLRYPDGAMATVVTSRCSGPVSEELSLHGRGGSIVADNERCLLRDPDGNVLDEATDDQAPVAVFRRQAEAFLEAVASPSPRYACSARENLLTLATIEALYLSNRTGQPEHPRDLLRTLDFDPKDCLAVAPLDEPEQLPEMAPGTPESARPDAP